MAFDKPSGATVFLLNCLAGKGEDGTKLLLGLGRILGEQHKIVGFARRARLRGAITIDRSFWSKETCTPTGVTIIPQGADAGKKETPATEDHWSAKAVVGGRVKDWPAGEGPNATGTQASNSTHNESRSEATTRVRDNRPIQGFYRDKNGKGHRPAPK